MHVRLKWALSSLLLHAPAAAAFPNPFARGPPVLVPDPQEVEADLTRVLLETLSEEARAEKVAELERSVRRASTTAAHSLLGVSIGWAVVSLFRSMQQSAADAAEEAFSFSEVAADDALGAAPAHALQRLEGTRKPKSDDDGSGQPPADDQRHHHDQTSSSTDVVTTGTAEGQITTADAAPPLQQQQRLRRRRRVLRDARRLALRQALTLAPLFALVAAARRLLPRALAARVDAQEALLFGDDIVDRYADALDVHGGGGAARREEALRRARWTAEPAERRARRRARMLGPEAGEDEWGEGQ